MRHLTELYEVESGEKALYRVGASDYHTLRYVKWLEAMVERFTSTNKASTQCSLYTSCKYPIKSCCCTGVPICHKK